MMNKIISDHTSPLFAQFARYSLAPFDKDSSRELISKILPELKNPDFIQEIYLFTCGNPFYITVLCERIRNLSHTISQIDESLIRTVFILEALSKNGKIYAHSQYVYDLSLKQATGDAALRNILRLLAEEEGQP
jgi:hypothetical protein